MTAGGQVGEELEVLQARRRTLGAALAAGDGPGDRADQAEAIELADELARIEDRIAEITRRPARPDPSGDLLLDGTRVRLRYPDGGTETVHVGEPAEAERVDGEPVLTASSPLGLALAGRRPGDRITYPTPEGAESAEVVAVWPPPA